VEPTPEEEPNQEQRDDDGLRIIVVESGEQGDLPLTLVDLLPTNLFTTVKVTPASSPCRASTLNQPVMGQ
jgi:hypothetical protein